MVNLIDRFVHATSNMASPEIFRRWCAISMVSMAMSRRVWTCIEDDLPLFPNIYVFLVGRPGQGKSRPLRVVKAMLQELGEPVVFCPNEITKERMTQHMGEVFKGELAEGAMTYAAVLSEFATFMPEADAKWMQAISDLWDCPELYERQTKHMGCDYLYNPYVCMLAGVQPAWFAEGFPQNSYELGFPARCFFIYADEKPAREFFLARKQVVGMDNLLLDLHAISLMSGPVYWLPEAQDAWVKWAQEGLPPVVDDPLLAGYSARRDMHAGKLALIVAAATHPEHKVITRSDLECAWSYLFDAEKIMPHALMNAGGNIYKLREEAILQFVRGEYERTRSSVAEQAVRRRLGRMVSSTLITPIINELIAQGRLKSAGTDKLHHRLLKPGS